MRMKQITLILAALLFVTPFQAANAQEHKSRKQLEKENIQLRQRLESIQQELEWVKADKSVRDSLEKQLEELYLKTVPVEEE